MLKGWKTMIFNVATFALATLAVINPNDLPLGDNGPYIVMGVAIINVWLRMITTSPAFKK